jgi:hypothetical protein
MLGDPGSSIVVLVLEEGVQGRAAWHARSNDDASSLDASRGKRGEEAMESIMP